MIAAKLIGEAGEVTLLPDKNDEMAPHPETPGREFWAGKIKMGNTFSWAGLNLEEAAQNKLPCLRESAPRFNPSYVSRCCLACGKMYVGASRI